MPSKVWDHLSNFNSADYNGAAIEVWEWIGNFILHYTGRSITKRSSTFSTTNFSSYIIDLLQLHDTIQIKWNYAWISYNIAIRSHLTI